MAAASAGTIQSGGVPELVPGAITATKSTTEISAVSVGIGVGRGEAVASIGVAAQANRLTYYPNNTDLAVCGVGGGNSVRNSHPQHNQLQNNYNQQTGIPNLASGWKRIIVNCEIIYIR